MEDITLLTIVSASFTFIIVLLKLIFKSKCLSFECCGIKVTRDIKAENEEHKWDIEHNIKDDDLEIIKQSIK